MSSVRPSVRSSKPPNHLPQIFAHKKSLGRKAVKLQWSNAAELRETKNAKGKRPLAQKKSVQKVLFR